MSVSQKTSSPVVRSKAKLHSEQSDISNVKQTAERNVPIVGKQPKRRETSMSAIEVAQRAVSKHMRKGDQSVVDELLQDRRKEVKRER